MITVGRKGCYENACQPKTPSAMLYSCALPSTDFYLDLTRSDGLQSGLFDLDASQ
jgi:hypothetical protein